MFQALNQHVQCVIYYSPWFPEWSRMAPDELMLSLFVLDFIPDVRPITSNLARLGSFSQITNVVISLLIQTGPSFSDSVDCHKAVKHPVTLVRTSKDEKWHTGAALIPEFLPWLWSLIAAVLFPSLCFKVLSFTKLQNTCSLNKTLTSQKTHQRKKKFTMHLLSPW